MDGASAASATHAAQAVEVDLIHETLVRSRRRNDSGNGTTTAATSASARQDAEQITTVPHWKTLWDYVETHADRGHWQDRLDHAFDEWKGRRHWQRAFGLPAWDDLKAFRQRLRLKRGSEQDRFVHFGRAVWRVRVTTVAVLVVVWSLWLVPNEDRLHWSAQTLAIVTWPAWALGEVPEPDLESPPPARVTFEMGCKDGRDNKLGFSCKGIPEAKQVEIIAPCWMATHLVRNLDYRRFLWRLRGFAAVLDHARKESWDFAGSTQPVVEVKWSDAAEYAVWLSESIAQRHRDVPAMDYRLPHSAEWEYAARNRNNDYMYPWGDSSVRGHAANCNIDIGCRTAPVDSFKQTESGIYDIVGNVYQWTADKVFPEEVSDQPRVRRVLRGGYWSDIDESLRAASRYQSEGDYSSINFGFRLCRSSPTENPATTPLNTESPKR
jgi:formylglycine-generating enzyme required for sulfatase activity